MRMGEKQREFLGEYLMACRKNAGFTQKDISDKLGYDSPQYISNIERGVCATPVGHLRLFVELYKIPRGNFISMLQGLYAESVKRELSL